MNFDDKVWENGIKKKLWAKNDLILVACSGGVDSMGLLEFFNLWQVRRRIKVMAVHCDHQIRGTESEKDAQNVKSYCEKKNIPIIIKNLGVLEYKANWGGNLEEIARNLRYKALKAVAHEHGAHRIALGHHLGDQAETVLLHLLRGSGGFRGMAEHEGILIRPFLSVMKKEIIKFVEMNRVPYWEDSSNQNCDFKRNWIRNQLLPLIETIEPEAQKTVSRWADIQESEEQFWQIHISNWLDEHSLKTKDGISIPIKSFQLLTLAEKRRVIRVILSNIKNSLRGIELSHVESVIGIAEKNVGNSQICLPAAISAKVLKGRLYLLLNKKEEIEICGPRY